MDVHQPEFWNGPSERLPDGFTVTNQSHSAVCEVWTHPAGSELRLTIDGHSLPTTTVVRSGPEMVALVEQWRAAMLALGWS
jgi:hypothetical protein